MDVQERLEDLIPWFTELKGSLTAARTGDICEEAERREQSIQSVSHTCFSSRILAPAPFPDGARDRFSISPRDLVKIIRSNR